jgi:Domain of unknown function (DUF4168)
MRPSTKLVAAAAIAAMPLLSASAALAQGKPVQTQPQVGAQSAANIPDDKLNAAAAAIDHVASIKHDYEQKMAKAPDSDRNKIADDANNAIEKAITDQGLSVEEYSSILHVAQNNPDVRNKLLQRLHPPAQ